MADVEVYDQESLGDSSVTADSLMSEFNHLAIYWVCLVTSYITSVYLACCSVLGNFFGISALNVPCTIGNIVQVKQ